MSKKKTSLKFREKYPREVGKFYFIYDSSGGHPALVYYADPTNDIYYIQRFSTKYRKGRVLLKHNIDPTSSKEQWLVKRPELVDYDGVLFVKKYENFKVHPDDLELVKKYQKFDLSNKKMDVRCESQQGVSKHMTSSTKIIKTKK